MTHQISLLETVPLTTNTTHYTFSKPKGFDFKLGQATDLAIDRDGWRDEKRPFTFTSGPETPVLSFVIKSYPDHDGVTKELPKLEIGDTALIGDPWGAIEDKGPGTFIAGGAGITPFIGILRERARRGKLDGCHLVFANKTPEDIILYPLWKALENLRVTYVVSQDAREGMREGHIDAALLDDVVDDWGEPFYVCGPPAMEDAVVDLLRTRDVADDLIIRES